MTILFAASEFDSLAGTFPGNTQTNSGTNRWDPNFARGALQLSQSAPGPWWPNIALGDIAEAWFHMRLNSNVIANNFTLCEIRNNVGTGVVRLRGVGTNLYRFQYWDGAAWQNMGAANLANPSGAVMVDIHVLIDNSVGVFELFIDGASVVSLTGDTDLFSGSALDQWRFLDWSNTVLANSATYITEIIISTTSTLGLRVATLIPTGPTGTYNQWTGSYQDIDEWGVNDADFISATGPNLDSTFNVTDLTATAQLYDPVAVVLGTRGRIGATGPSNIQTLVRTNSNDYTGPNTNPTTSFASLPQTIYELNPQTSAVWTISEINALEIGVKSIT